MSVRMADVHFAHAPGHVSRRPGDFDSLLSAEFVNGVNIVDPNTHPNALVGHFASITAKRGRVRTFAASALRIPTKEDFAMPGADGAECGRIAPVEALFPAKLFEP